MTDEPLAPKSRSRRFFAVWISLAVAVAVVAIAIPQRRQADASDTTKWIPMRNLTPQEAAALLGQRASLARIGADTVDLVTDVYLVPVEGSPDPSTSLLRRGDKVWQPIAASWENYFLRYRLDRAPLERELGGRPLSAFLDPRAKSKRISFRSEWLPLYAVLEVALLWATFLLVWIVLRLVRPLPLVMPALLLVTAGFVAAVLAYSPALFDADFFCQRWAVEPIALALMLLGVPALLWGSALSLLALLGLGALRLMRRGAPPAQRIAASWAPFALLLLAGITAHVYATVTERRALDRIAGSLHWDETVLGEARALHHTVKNFVRLETSQLPPHLRRFVTDAFAAMPVVPDGGSVVLLPIEGGDCLFLWRRPEFTYVDFREPVAQISQDEIDMVRETRSPVVSGFLEQAAGLTLRFSADRFDGRPLLDRHGRLWAVVYVERSINL